MPDNEIKITKRHLPHWQSDEAIYFITFKTRSGKLSHQEQLLVKEHIIAGNKLYYVLYGVVVMPDHVHLILKPCEGFNLSRIMKGIKGKSARLINELRGIRAKIWQDESFDRIIRDQKEFDEKMTYMFNNPEKDNLTDDSWEYQGWFYNEEL